jgi:hypothetical protein
VERATKAWYLIRLVFRHAHTARIGVVKYLQEQPRTRRQSRCLWP